MLEVGQFEGRRIFHTQPTLRHEIRCKVPRPACLRYRNDHGGVVPVHGRGVDAESRSLVLLQREHAAQQI